jgi:hypothetical protein
MQPEWRAFVDERVARSASVTELIRVRTCEAGGTTRAATRSMVNAAGTTLGAAKKT